MMTSGVICGLYMGTYVRCIYEYVSPKCKTLFFITLPHKLTKGLKTWGYNDSPKNGGSLTLKVYINPSVFLPMPLSIYPTIDLSTCLSNCLSTYLSIYLSLYPSIYPSIYLSLPLSIYLSIYPSIYLSIHPSIYLSILLPIYLSNYPSVCLSISLSIHMSTCLSVCLSIYLSIHPSIHPPIHLSIYPSLSLSLSLSVSLSLSPHSAPQIEGVGGTWALAHSIHTVNCPYVYVHTSIHPYIHTSIVHTPIHPYIHTSITSYTLHYMNYVTLRCENVLEPSRYLFHGRNAGYVLIKH